jgi:hypothetical protein
VDHRLTHGVVIDDRFERGDAIESGGPGSVAALRNEVERPDTFENAEYNRHDQPCTYSDLAGGQINNVTCNPQQ